MAAAPISVDTETGQKKTIDFPDPSITRVDDTYYAYSTGSGFSSLQTIKSTDLVHWTWVGDPFSGPGPFVGATAVGSTWADLFGHTWGPAMLTRPDNPPESRYVLYYASKSQVGASAGVQCIGRAVSASPEGPFTDTESAPLLCTPERGGSVDPSPIVANGQLYLSWQSYGLPTGEPTRIWTTPLTHDGLSIAGASTQNLEMLGWSFEPPVIEGPAMMPAPDGGYLLFYSTGLWHTENYRAAVAWCATPTSACSRIFATPVLATRVAMAGPGGPSLFQDFSGNWTMAFHAWTAPYIDYTPDDTRYARTLRMLPVTFPDGGHNPKIG